MPRPFVWASALVLTLSSLGLSLHAASQVAARPTGTNVAPAAGSASAVIRGEEIRATLETLHRAHASVTDGTVYASGAKQIDPAWFGIAVAMVSGEMFAVGEADRAFPIQSTAKVFTYGLALEDHGSEVLLERVGVNATGLPYGSLIASEVRSRRLQNPMVSAGAISTMALIRGKDEETRWNRVREAFARYAGERLSLNREVVRYEIANSTHSFALANALLTRQLLWYPAPGGAEAEGFVAPSADDVGALVRRYLRSTSQDVSVETLAIMGATLANGGVNPRTGVRAADRENVLYILSAMLTAGMYDASGEWMSRVGVPAKSGVSGNILAVVPGRMAIAVYSPPLDASGNSVRGLRVIEDLARRWSLHVLISDQHNAVEKGDINGD